MLVCLRSGLVSALLCAVFPVFALEAGAPLPAVSLPSLKGEAVSLDTFREQVVLVNFWATWCGPCRQELPALEALRQRYKDRGFDVVGVNVDSERANAAAFVEQFKLSYTVLLDPEFTAAKQFGANAMPISYLVGRDGRVARVFTGFSKKKWPLMEAAVAEMVGAAAP